MTTAEPLTTARARSAGPAGDGPTAGQPFTPDRCLAGKVEPTSPATGVCSAGAGMLHAVEADRNGGCCCAPAPRLARLGAPAAGGAAAEQAPAGGCSGS